MSERCRAETVSTGSAIAASAHACCAPEPAGSAAARKVQQARDQRAAAAGKVARRRRERRDRQHSGRRLEHGVGDVLAHTGKAGQGVGKHVQLARAVNDFKLILLEEKNPSGQFSGGRLITL